ncbi:hypothetical protein GQ44DRAFT_775483 [Phaeosphaeriaceae sp. PMI808]|nr:hypothetical protein GQ44DRAFT_775483 [Phaeosphaeriaceae sp. PMI808]
MREIYARARNVIISIGSPWDPQEVDFPFAQNTFKMIKNIVGLSDQGAEWTGSDKEATKGLSARPEIAWDEFRNIFKRAWFSRIWVIQELALSSNAYILCGGAIIPYQDLVKAASWRPDICHPERGLDAILFHSSAHRVRVLSTLHDGARAGKRPHLLKLLLDHRECESTDPRDMIFGLLGLTESDILPDYRKEVKELYLEIAKMFVNDAASAIKAVLLRDTEDVQVPLGSVQYDDFLKMMCCAGTASQDIILPSWVPDWSFTPKTVDFPARSQSPTFDNLASLAKLKIDRLKLMLPALLLDEIEHSTTHSLDLRGASDKVWWTRIASWLNECCSIVHERYFDPESSRSMFLSCFSYPSPGSLSWRWTEPRDSITTAFNTSLRANTRYIEAKREFADGTGLGLFEMLNGLATIMGQHELMSLLEAPLNFCNTLTDSHGRVFFTTKMGLMGLAPEGARCGDIISLPLSSVCPIVIRRISGNEFTLLGNSYVHGVGTTFSIGARDFEILEII